MNLLVFKAPTQFTTLAGSAVVGLFAFNGTAFSLVTSNSASNISSVTQPGAIMEASPGEWSVFSTPVISTQATATRAAGVAGVRHVCRSIAYTHDAPVAQTALTINLRDGVSGVGPILWSKTIKLPLAAQPLDINLTGLNIVGSAATAMTLEFSGAPVAGNTQSVAMTGYSTV